MDQPPTVQHADPADQPKGTIGPATIRPSKMEELQGTSETISQRKAALKRQRKKNRKTRKNITNFVRKEAQKSEIITGSRYPNLIAGSAKITIEYQTAAALFVHSLMDPSTANLNPRVVFFADGSVRRNKDIGGAGVTSQHLPAAPSQWNDARMAIAGVYRSYDAQLVAIGFAMELALSETRSEQQNIEADEEESRRKRIPDIYIISDAQHSLKDIKEYLASSPEAAIRKSPKFLHPPFADLIHNLDRIAQHRIEVRLHWVKSHTGIEGHGRADRLANTAAEWFISNPRKNSDKPYDVYRLQTTSMELEEGARKRNADAMDSDSKFEEERPRKKRTRQHRIERRKTMQKVSNLNIDNDADTQTTTNTKGTVAIPDEQDPDMERYKRMFARVLAEDDINNNPEGSPREEYIARQGSAEDKNSR